MAKDKEVMRLKPDMTLVPSPVSKEWQDSRAIRFAGETTAQAKADGEFNALFYNKDGETFTKNKYGRKETPETLPALMDFVEVMRKQSFEKAIFLVEMHVFHGKLLRVSDFIHYLKGKDHTTKDCEDKPCYGLTVEQVRGKIRLGFFEMVEVDGTRINESASWQFAEMQHMIGTQKRLVVLPWTEVKNKKAVEKAWKAFVDKMGYEGLVTRNEIGEIFKLKPEYELDAVIVALNKNDGYSKRRGTSVRLALMIDKNTFLEIGDVASGIDHDLRDQLWLMKEEFGIDETKDKHYVQPIAVVKIVCHGIFQKQMSCWKFDGESRVDCGKRWSMTMRHPKLMEVRDDKTVTPKDIGLQQIPRGLFEDEGRYGT